MEKFLPTPVNTVADLVHSKAKAQEKANRLREGLLEINKKGRKDF